MYIPFEEMPKNARVWIYQADRSFSADEEASIIAKASDFLNQWASHGTPLKSSFKLFHQNFLVITVDEIIAQASGCSIDASVGLVKSIEQELDLNFFDRSKIAFLVGNEVYLHDMNQIKPLVTEGKISNTTLTFNNLVTDIEQLEKKWVIPANESWLKRYF